MNLLDYQVVPTNSMESALMRYGVVANTSEMGTGKTYMTCAVAKKLGMRMLVVGPKSVITEWKSVAERWGVPCDAITYDSLRTGKHTQFGRWARKRTDWRWSVDRQSTLIVFDEVHWCGGVKSLNSQMLLAAKRWGYKHVLLSGTLFDTPLRARAIGYSLGLHRDGNDFYDWARRHGCADGFWGGVEWRPDVPFGLTLQDTKDRIMADINREIGDRMVRIRKRDIPGFPEKQVIPMYCTIPRIPKVYGNYTVEAREFAENGKVETIFDMVDTLLEQGYSVPVFVSFRSTLDLLRAKYPNAPVVSGDNTAEQRADAIRRFQENTAHVLLIMIQAGGTGVNLHDLHGRPRAAIICPGYKAVELRQAIDRTHRAGALSPAIVYILFAEQIPVERRIRENLEVKLSNLDSLNDGDLLNTHENTDPSGTVPQNSRGTENTNSTGTDECDERRGDEEQRQGGPSTDSSQDDQSSDGQLEVPMSGPVLNTTNRKHALCSPSKLKNREICPSYDSDDSGEVHELTERGTIMHDALETGDDSKLIEGEHELVRMVREAIRPVVAMAIADHREIRVETGDPDVFGYLDRVLILPGNVGHILDYKMGMNAIPPAILNPQGKAYVLGVFRKFPDLQELTITFLQPRISWADSWTWKRSDMPELECYVRTVADRWRAFHGKAFHPNFDNCLYCANKKDCAELHRRALPLATANKEEDSLLLPTELNPARMSTPEDVRRGLDLCHIMEKFCEQMRARALQLRQETGMEIPGYDYVQSSGKRRITNPTAAFDVARRYNVSIDQFIGCCSVSAPQLVEAASAHAPRGQKKVLEERFQDELRDADAISRDGGYWALRRCKKKAVSSLDVVSTVPNTPTS